MAKLHIGKEVDNSVQALEGMIGERDAKIDALTKDLNRRTSSIEVRKFSINSGTAPTKMNNLSLMSKGMGNLTICKTLPCDPAGVVDSREKEKIALQELNERFANYIERVRYLEFEKKRLESIILEFTEKFKIMDAALTARIEGELADARKVIDKTTTELGAATLRADNAEKELKRITVLYNDECATHILTREKLPAYEKMISERDAQIDYLTKNLLSLQTELDRIKSQSAGTQSSLSIAKQATDAEIVKRIELESIIQTKEDEIAFMTGIYNEKVNTFMSLDLGSDAFQAQFSNELALALRDIRNEYESIMEATRSQDTDAWYRAKFNEVIAVTTRQTTDLQHAKDEAKNWRSKYHSIYSEFSTLKAMIGGLENTIAQLRADLAAKEQEYSVSLADRDATILAKNYEIGQLISSLRELTDIKLALDAEIATYRRLLMAEDGRIYSKSADIAVCNFPATTTTTTTTKTIINPFTITFNEEDEYFRCAFAYCDADKSGHVTATELKNAFEWMNKNVFGSRGQRDASYPYVNAILKRGDVDSSLTLEYHEFCQLLRLEKKIFVEDSLSKFAGGVCSLDDTIKIFKQAGYVYTDGWVPFLKQYQQPSGQITIRSVVQYC